jgi:hypothetical protein
MMRAILYYLFVLLVSQLAYAQGSTTKIDMVNSNWNTNDQTTFERFDDRESLLLKRGRITVKDLQFSNGTIEVDVYAKTSRSFAGITFRKQGQTMEEVYMRMHKSNQVDAVQYTPIFNNESNWQLYNNYQAKVSFKNTGWNTLRIDVNGKNAIVSVNGEEVLTVDHLRTEHDSGEIGLFALFTARFSNLRVTHKEEIKQPITSKFDNSNPHIITEWAITKAMPFTGEELQFEDLAGQDYNTVKTEVSGLLPISKYVNKVSSGSFEQNPEDYIVASTSVFADKEEVRSFSFDYSDKIIVYLNGEKLFSGNNAFRAKGIQYMGHMGINANTLHLPLQKGVNKIHCVVIDKANGWGLMAKLD